MATAAAAPLRRPAALLDVASALLHTLTWAVPCKHALARELVSQASFLLAAAAATDARSRQYMSGSAGGSGLWAEICGLMHQHLGNRRAALLQLTVADAVMQGKHPAAAPADAAAAAEAAQDAADAAAQALMVRWSFPSSPPAADSHH